MAMVLPLLTADGAAAPDAELLHPASAESILWCYNLFVSLTFYGTLTHASACIMFYIMTSYLTDAIDVIWFFVTFPGGITYINIGLMPNTIALAVAAALGGEELRTDAYAMQNVAFKPGGTRRCRRGFPPARF